ncbi:hypothetical protein QVN01_22525 [Pseudomonas aeruginosa]|uniref:DUF7740 domain-containing protein n=1 Tax=Pseudomonas aeruginosa TaxID=287 RepID=UPI00106CDA65|nr:hypothetical protein [Pseudomonas aeruginosa]MCO2282475.1 hypothetical protein [Pseudomonas aeruginosa]MCO2308634.1 hypothetical protein [Pseudomonas aeruginosa]MCO2900839.1 hypothetical protein [Pseudomonas aeruginosa]MDM1424834.1 hypothetical protein [Pseudomonas aeruginosa]
MKQKPGIALPRWLLRTTTMQMHSVDVVLVMALVLQHHGTADAVRRAAGQLRDRVCAEHRPKMTALMRMQNDAAALQVALNIVQRATDALGILPGTPFPARPSPSESPPDQGHMPAKAGPVTGEPVHPT